MKQFNKLKVFIFCLIVFSIKSPAQATYDVFPLTGGMHYTYIFFQEYKFYHVLALTNIHSDSGSVEYTILDSLEYGDTLMVWNIEQRRNILHRDYNFPSDTTYEIRDTSYYQLSESLTGDHELKCSSMVWFFPLNVWPPNFSWTGPDSSIYRYSDFSNFLSVLSSNMYDPLWVDSIWFSNEAGIYRRVTGNYWGSSITHGSYKRYLYRSDIPTDAKQSNWNIVKDYVLSQNYPNPFNPTTSIQYSVGSRQFVTLKVYDMIGSEVATLVNEEKSVGSYEVEFSAKGGSAYGGDTYNLPSGVYLYQLRAGSFIAAKKLILLK